MKILLISSYFPIKRTESVSGFVYDEASELVKEGVDVHVAFWKYANRLFRSRDWVVDGIKVHGLKLFSPVDVCSGFSNLPKLPFYLFSPKEIVRTGVFLSRSKQVEKIAKDYDVDVIHAHFAHPSGLVGSFVKQYTHKPLVISVWGYDVLSDPISYGALSRRDTAYLVKRALMAADAVVVGAEIHYETVIQLVGKERSDKVHFINPGIDTVRFNSDVDGSGIREKLGIRADQPVILFAKHLKPLYGSEYLVQAIPEVIKKHPDAMFLFLGEGPMKGQLQTATQSFGIAKNVIFVGYVPKTEMPFYHAASDISVDPSYYGQGYAALEAMACGKPVVGFREGQIKIIDNVNGFLVDPYNVKALADKIVQLIDDAKLRKEMGLRGRRYVVDNCGINVRVKKLIELYKAISVRGA